MNLKSTDPLFCPAHFFMVRLPFLSINQMKQVLNSAFPENSLIDFYQQNSVFQEAVALASPSLYHSLSVETPSPQTIVSLLKYFSRMATRATPFGLFSFISCGEWGENISYSLQISKVRKRARPDMEWVFKFSDHLSKNPLYMNQIPVQTNPLLVFSGGKAYLKYQMKTSGAKSSKDISIRLSPLVEKILEIAFYPIPLADLEKKLIEYFPGIDLKKANHLIQNLIDQQILNFTLASSLLVDSPIKEMIGVCEHQPLIDLNKLIENYNALFAGETINDVFQIEQFMQGTLDKASQEATNRLQIQVDAFYQDTSITLPHIVSQELTQAIEAIWHINSFVRGDSFLKSYHEKFLEKYGTTRLVPLLELLSEDKGLGIPKSYDDDTPPHVAGDRNLSWEYWLNNKLITILKQGKMEIEITESDLLQFTREQNLESVPPSLDVYFDVSATSSRAIEHGDFNLVVNMIMPQACSTFGRFFDFLDNPQKEWIKKFLKQEEQLMKEAKFVESSYVPHMSRGANVAIHQNLRKYAIDLGKFDKESIHLKDLYVGANLSRLYITLKDGKEELIVTVGNLLNPTHAPIPLRFIRDVSKMQFVYPIQWSWGRSDAMQFLPRIRYGKTILNPAQWHFDIRTETKLKTHIEISNAFQEWADFWNMPNEVYMGLDDQRLYVDRSHPTFLSLIVKELKKNKRIHLREKITHDWLRSDQGTHCGEFVLPFVKKTPYNSSSADIKPSFKPLHIVSRFKLPGSEWLFVKVFLARENENEFLLNHLLPFLQPFIQKGVVKNWFFVRYQDPLNHLRIRFKGDPQIIQEVFEPTLKKWLHKLFEAHVLNDITFAIYEREVERYGGDELIDIAEEMFGDDARVALSLIQIIKDKKISIPEHILGALSVLDLVSGFDFSFDKLLNFFTPAPNTKMEMLAGARIWKDKLPKMIRCILGHTEVESDDAITILRTTFSQRKVNQNHYLKKIRKMKSERTMHTSFGVVINSLIHMHVNRFIGFEPDKELKVRLYAHYGLSKLAARACD